MNGRVRDILYVSTPHYLKGVGARRRIIDEIARLHGFSSSDLTCPSGAPKAREPDLCRARFHAMTEIRRQFGDSYPRIAGLFGGRDHTSVLHGVRRWGQIEAEMAAQNEAVQ